MQDHFPALDQSFSEHAVSFRDFASYVVLEHTIAAAIMGMGVPFPTPETITRATSEEPPAIDEIGIVGAGASGLYAAMILESLGIPYEILEASDRIGGRIFTHRFNGDAGKNAPINTPARYDYFDVGAMRFPRISFMQRVFDLFKTVEIEHLQVEYKLASRNNLLYYNTQPPLNSTIHTTEPKEDYFRVSVKNDGTVPNDYVAKGPDAWTADTFKYFIDWFKKIEAIPPSKPDERREAFKKAWSELMKQDHNSTRGYMLAGTKDKPPGALAPFPGPVVEWLETFESATGLYDLALTESIMDALDFGTAAASRDPKPLPQDRRKINDKIPKEPDSGWVCIDGGSDHIIEGMLSKISHRPITNTRVTKIEPTDKKTMRVYDSSGKTREYSQVIMTAPLGCVGAMDLDHCGLLWNQKLAIRSLQYDTSTKVAIKFATRWWEDPAFMNGCPIKGGVSNTDVPIRVCVYPSYGADCPPGTPPPGVLLASYTWAQDARRLGSLVQGKDTEPEKVLVELVLDNICKLHGIPRSKLPPVIDYFAHDWYHDQYSRGAFALFGPAQFGYASSTPTLEASPASMFAALKAPAAKGKLHFAGEATSVHHAWVLGALNSAWRAVYNALEGRQALQDKLIEKWGIPDEVTEIKLKKLNILSRYKAL